MTHTTDAYRLKQDNIEHVLGTPARQALERTLEKVELSWQRHFESLGQIDFWIKAGELQVDFDNPERVEFIVKFATKEVGKGAAIYHSPTQTWNVFY